MNNQSWKPYVFFILLAETVGVLSAFLTRTGMENYNMIVKPALTPPSILFPIVWTILFALMGIGAARIWLSPPSPDRTQSLILFTFQLIVNFFWSLFFFNLQAFGFSFLWLIILWILILLMILSYQKVDKIAAWLQIPYLLWVTFAGYLNYMVWMLN
jgi:benzodiazapine receptor